MTTHAEGQPLTLAQLRAACLAYSLDVGRALERAISQEEDDAIEEATRPVPRSPAGWRKARATPKLRQQVRKTAEEFVVSRVNEAILGKLSVDPWRVMELRRGVVTAIAVGQALRSATLTELPVRKFTLDGRKVQAGRFLADNGFGALERLRVVSLAVGDSITYGGGAAASFTLTRKE